MEISGAHQQAMASHGLEEILGSCSNPPQPERKPRTQPEHALKCPRCDSTNTKFCYYNNYSLSQPRYFCKGCRRYWTKGGSLRNVPVGGGCRKKKRSSTSSSSSSSNPNSNSLRSRPQEHQSFISANSIPPLPSLPPSLPPLSYEHSDLTLAFARLQNQQQQQWPVADHETFLIGNPNPNPVVPGVGFLNIMGSGFVENGGRNGFHHFYSGFSGSCSAVEDVEGSTTTTGGQEVLLPLENSSTAGEGGERLSSEGWCKAVGGGESKVLMGLQWPIGVDGGMGMEWVLH